MSIVKVRVTQKDIRLGQKKLGRVTLSCAVARAVQRRFRDKQAHWAYITGKANNRIIEATAAKTVRRWVERHDAHPQKVVKPFTLRLRIEQ